MGLRGPKPKPLALRRFEGNPSHRPMVRGPAPAPCDAGCTVAPDCPDWLGEVGKAKWAELAPQLRAVGLLTGLDTDALSLYCHAHDYLHATREILARDGLTVPGSRGNTVPHPAVALQAVAVEQIRRFGALFGLTPASRASLRVAPAPEEDDLDRFLLRGSDPDPLDGQPDEVA